MTRRLVQTQAIVFALAAPAMLGVTTWLLSWRDALALLGHAWPQITAGFATMFGIVLATARPLAHRFAAAPELLRPWNVALFFLGTLAACTCNWALTPGREFESEFMKPAIAVLAFGVLPALVLGQIAVWIHRRGD